MLRTALRRVLARPRLIVGLWLLALLLSALGSLPVLLVLRGLLDDRPLAMALSRGEADFLFGELFSDHPALPLALLGSLLSAAIPGWLLSAALAGGVVDALRRPGDPRRVIGSAVLGRAAQTAGAMLRLFVLGLLARLPLLLLVGAVAFALRKGLPGRGMVPILVAGGGAALLLSILWSALSVALDYARFARLSAPDRAGATRRALRFGLRQALRTPGPTILLAALSVLGLLLVFLVGRDVAARLDHAGAAVGLVFLVRQLLALCRTTLLLTARCGAVEVSSVQQPLQ